MRPSRPRPRYRSAAAQEQQEERSTEEGRHDAHRQFGGRRERARREIGQDQKARPAEECRRQEQAMVGTEQTAQEVRHDQADEADEAGTGHGQRRGQ